MRMSPTHALARPRLTDASEGQAQYLCEDELQRSCETVEQLRRDLKEALDAQGAHVGGLRGGSVREQASGEAEEEIEEEIEEMICDGLCAAAVDLRRQLEALEQERHRSSILQLHANGSADGEDDHGVATQGSVQGAEGKGDQLGDWPSCGGRCDSAERLRRQVFLPSLLFLSSSLPSHSAEARAGGEEGRGWVGATQLREECSAHLATSPPDASAAREKGAQTRAPGKRVRLATRALLATPAVAKESSRRTARAQLIPARALLSLLPPSDDTPRWCQLQAAEARGDDAELESEVRCLRYTKY